MSVPRTLSQSKRTSVLSDRIVSVRPRPPTGTYGRRFKWREICSPWTVPPEIFPRRFSSIIPPACRIESDSELDLENGGRICQREHALHPVKWCNHSRQLYTDHKTSNIWIFFLIHILLDLDLDLAITPQLYHWHTPFVCHLIHILQRFWLSTIFITTSTVKAIKWFEFTFICFYIELNCWWQNFVFISTRSISNILVELHSCSN